VALGQHELVRAGWLAVSLGGSALLYFALLLISGIQVKHFIKRA
jgi:putative peptidoglycan lipid II flippase